jgi:methionyl-tRNA formyltransferase
MPSSIILLCPTSDRIHLIGALTLHNPALKVVHVETLPALELAVERAAPGTRLIAFLTPVVVPAAVLARLDGPAYNFHPGSPEYPGKHPVAFAVYDGAARYGGTVHEMVPMVDSGPIVGTVTFDVPPGAGHGWIMDRACEAVVRLFQVLAPRLAGSDEPLPRLGIPWGTRRCSQRALDALCALPPDIGREELERRERSIARAHGARLHMTVHGRRFVMEE